MHSLLLGNGLNRLSQSADWVSLLRNLAIRFDATHLVKDVDKKPLSILFEELCASRETLAFRAAEREIKQHIAAIIGDPAPTDLHRQFADLFTTILTTNYDDSLERAISGPIFTRSPVFYESRYSLFRRSKTCGREIWHLHGESAYPESILLGYDHYAGYLQKIRNYVTDGLLVNRRSVVSPLKAGANLFDCYSYPHSWVDHVLRDHLHIVGFGMDFTEIDLWWLLIHKRRRKNVTGKTFFYSVTVPDGPPSPPQLSVLGSFAVDLFEVHASTYESGYAKILDEVKSNIHRYPYLLPSSASRAVNSTVENIDYYDAETLQRTTQLPLRLRRKRNKSV